MKIALQNGKVLRTIGGQVQGPPAFLTANPTAAPTIYDPAIVETDARFGIAAGESLFDPTWTTDFFWEQNHEPRNVNQVVCRDRCRWNLHQDAFQFQTALTKTTADGTQLSMSSSTSYDLRAQRSDPPVPLGLATTFQMEIRQPLLKGTAWSSTRSPVPERFPASTRACCWRGSTSNRAGTVRGERSATWSPTWNPPTGNCTSATAIWTPRWRAATTPCGPGRRPMPSTSRREGGERGLRGPGPRAVLHLRPTRPNRPKSSSTGRAPLRFLMGIPATDGRLIRPKDDPTTAKITFDWSECSARRWRVRWKSARPAGGSKSERWN